MITTRSGRTRKCTTTTTSTSFNVEVTILLKYLISNYWRFLDLPLIKCELELDLSWTKDCVLIQHHDNIEGVNVMMTSAKLYIPVVTLTVNDKIKFLENMAQG